MSPAPARALVVSLHDVSPRTHADCELILGELETLGVTKTSLLVVPDHHHRGNILADATFCAWLAEKERHGHEIVTHGYYHRRARRTGETAMQKFTTRLYTADEGEFYDLDRATARDLVTRGNADLKQAGTAPHGFIAPAWLLSAEAGEALRELGVKYTTTLGTVRDVQREQTWPSQSLVWSVRSGWRRAISLAWNASLFQRLRKNPLLRISIHPVDLAHGAIWKQIRMLIRHALADRRPLTYHDWLLQWRTSESPR